MAEYQDIVLTDHCQTRTEGREIVPPAHQERRTAIDTVGAITQSFTSNSASSDAESQIIKSDMAIRALRSFLTCTGQREISPKGITEDLLRIWTASMARDGVSPTTRTRYLASLSSRYATSPATLSELRKQAADPALTRKSKQTDILSSLRRLVEETDRLSGIDSIHAKALLLTLYDPKVSLLDIISMTFETYCPTIEQAKEIIEAMRAPRRKYVFPLGQGRARTTTILSSLSRGISDILKRFRISTAHPVTDDLLSGVWVSTAIEIGLTLPEIRASLSSVPSDHPYLRIISHKDRDDNARNDITRRIADAISPTTPRWYAMRLRAGTTTDEIRKAINESIDISVELYSPSKTVTERVGKKIIVHDEPYIPGILFFRIKPGAISRLFSRIGSMAWCYRTYHSPAAPYAVIPDREMEIFQRIAGQFTSDVDLIFDNIPMPAPGRRVIITGGMMAGYEGIITDIATTDGLPTSRRVFRLEITGGCSLRWTAEVDERLIREL